MLEREGLKTGFLVVFYRPRREVFEGGEKPAITGDIPAITGVMEKYPQTGEPVIKLIREGDIAGLDTYLKDVLGESWEKVGRKLGESWEKVGRKLGEN